MPRVSPVGSLLRPYLSCIRCLFKGLGARGQTPRETGTVGQLACFGTWTAWPVCLLPSALGMRQQSTR